MAERKAAPARMCVKSQLSSFSSVVDAFPPWTVNMHKGNSFVHGTRTCVDGRTGVKQKLALPTQHGGLDTSVMSRMNMHKGNSFVHGTRTCVDGHTGVKRNRLSDTT